VEPGQRRASDIAACATARPSRGGREASRHCETASAKGACRPGRFVNNISTGCRRSGLLFQERDDGRVIAAVTHQQVRRRFFVRLTSCCRAFGFRAELHGGISTFRFVSGQPRTSPEAPPPGAAVREPTYPDWGKGGSSGGANSDNLRGLSIPLQRLGELFVRALFAGASVGRLFRYMAGDLQVKVGLRIPVQ